ncbi:MAG: 2-oxo acid dehydrogenase subunit E2 [SAR324 cluster bacterium]|nr:2-oxo acid dehydrogenase subunit E2 [SAR324 cluster bacterium]MCZ6533309.1 2-oxo acid dehydrogenase subunit E2 [SAR324 cluster bacterium]MCZ6558798.1 2-oxo acid dehydrogenase subunit E2 [SAR324 cluster bacterium]
MLFPQLGFATAEGTILNWLHEVGERVERGTPLVEVASEKAINVVVTPVDGVLLAVFAPAGAIVPEGETLGWIGQDGEQPPELTCRWLGWEADIAPPPEDLAVRLQGTAPNTREADREDEFPPFQPPEQVDKRYRSLLKKQIRDTTGKRMSQSWVDKPKVDLFAEINLSQVVAHREAEKQAGRQPPPFNVYIAHAVVRAFEEFPHLNCNWLDGRRVPLEDIHVGVAVALEESLLTISLKNLGGLSLREVERRYRSLIRKAAAMTLRREDLYGSSLTVTNLGEFEIYGFTPVINPPEVYILGIGELKDRVVVVDGKIIVAPVSYFCLSFDHRGVDGAPASRLLRSIKHHLEDYRDND